MAIILITGLTGYLAKHIALLLLQQGHSVRGTVRSALKGDAVLALPALAPFAEAGKLSYTIVPDLSTSDHAAAVKGVDIVVHAASPFSYDNALTWAQHKGPAVGGVQSVLKAVEAEPSVKQVIHISSFAAMADWFTPVFLQKGVVYNEDSWNPITDEMAENLESILPPEAQQFKGALLYCASKKFSELRASEMHTASSRPYKLTVLCPPAILGPTLDLTTPITSQGVALGIFSALLAGPTAPVMPDSLINYADVRDVARAVGLSIDKAYEGRLALRAGPFDNQLLADRAHVLFPELSDRLVVGKPGEHISEGVDGSGVPPNVLDSSKASQVLGITYRPLDETIRDAIHSVVQVEKALGQL